MSQSLPLRRIYGLLLTGIMAMAMGQTLVFALLPLLGRAVGLRELQIGAIITTSSLVYALATRVWGRRSDVWGRKRVILIGLSGYTLGTLLFTGLFWLGLEQGWRGLLLWLALIVARCLQSVVMAGTMPASNAYVSDITSTLDRTAGIARLGAANSIGTIIGPAMGGMLAAISLLAPLYMVAASTALCVLCIFSWLPESPRQHRADAPQTARLRYGDARYRHFLLIAAVMFIVFSVVQQTLAFYFQDVLQLSSRETARQVGFALMLAAALALFAQLFVVQRLSWPTWRLIQSGLLLLVAGSVFLALGRHTPLLFAGVACCGMGVGLCYPGCLAAASLQVDADEQGALAGLTSALPAIGSIIGPLWGAGLYELMPALPYAANLLLLLPLLLYSRKIQRASARP